jgi:hypothetical protein
MKKENLIPGKWYKSDKFNYYGKFLRLEIDKDWHFITSERISAEEYKNSEYGFCDDKKWILVDLSEIQKFLPPNHPDLIQNKTYELW